MSASSAQNPNQQSNSNIMSDEKYGRNNVTNPFTQTTHHNYIPQSEYRNNYDDNSAVMYDNG